MRHSNQNRTLSRTRSQRTALLRGLAVSMIQNGKIKTTTGKAKELRPFVESITTAAKSDTVASRRKVAAKLGNPSDAVVKKLFAEIATNYADRNGGYTRIVKMGRQASGKDEAVIEYV